MLITRKCPRTGYNETIHYSGNIHNKPKGWKVVKAVAR